MKPSKAKRKVILPPSPPRRRQASEVETPDSLTEGKEFIESLVREAKANWFMRGERRVAAVWIQEIDRDTAQDWLSRVDQTHQRNKSDGPVKRYRSDIANGHYVDAIPEVIFDYRGRCINTQHILTGFLQSGATSLVVTVMVHLDPKAYQAVDQNRKRSGPDTLKWLGVDRSGDVARVATVLYQYSRGYYADKAYMGARSGDQLPTNAEVEATLKQYPEIPNHLCPSPNPLGGFSLPAFRASSVVLHMIDPERAAKFMRSVIEGLGTFLDKHDPIYVLRTAVTRAHVKTSAKGGWLHGDTMLRVFKAWNHYRRGEPIIGPLYRKGEPFQEPLGEFPIPDSSRGSSRVH